MGFNTTFDIYYEYHTMSTCERYNLASRLYRTEIYRYDYDKKLESSKPDNWVVWEMEVEKGEDVFHEPMPIYKEEKIGWDMIFEEPTELEKKHEIAHISFTVRNGGYSHRGWKTWDFIEWLKSISKYVFVEYTHHTDIYPNFEIEYVNGKLYRCREFASDWYEENENGEYEQVSSANEKEYLWKTEDFDSPVIHQDQSEPLIRRLSEEV